MPISHDNIIYVRDISKIGGVESYVYYTVKKYQHLDIAVVCKTCDIRQKLRLEQFCPVYIHHGEHIDCKVIVINYDTSILDFVDEPKAYMVIHADYSQDCYKVHPEFKHSKLTKVFSITEYMQKSVKELFGVDTTLNYNPFVLESKEKPIILVSATRLSKIKGGERMKLLSYELDRQKVNYIWYVFTNDKDMIHSDNVIFMTPRLDVYKWIQQADALVQLSDTEALSYSIIEARAYGVQTVTTPLPYLESIDITNENAVFLNFDCSNIKEVVEKIKHVKKVKWCVPQDDYIKYFYKGKSKYKKEMKGLKKIRVKVKFSDMLHNNTIRNKGEVFIEEDERADLLITRGYAELLESIPAVETAVKKEAKKEKAVKEKAIKVPAVEKTKKEKKNAKK